MRPSRGLPPLECSRGVSPRKAANSRPLENAPKFWTVARSAEAVTGPTPGMGHQPTTPISDRWPRTALSAAVRSVENKAALMRHRARELMVGQRTGTKRWPGRPPTASYVAIVSPMDWGRSLGWPNGEGVRPANAPDS